MRGGGAAFGAAVRKITATYSKCHESVECDHHARALAHASDIGKQEQQAHRMKQHHPAKHLTSNAPA